MSNYSKSTDFASKDTLSSGDPNKIVKGTEIDAEFEAIETAVNSKINVTDIGTTVQAYDADLTTLGAGGASARSFLGLAAIASSGSASDLSTGTVGTARLGSGTASSSTYLRGDQTWASVTSLPGSQGQVFTSSGTFTIPSGITAVKVTVIGGGGGGGGSQTASNTAGGAGGGGAGGIAVSYLSGLTSGNTLAVTIGAAGSAGASNGNGGAGGTTSVASGTQTISTISATGGGGGGRGNTMGAAGTRGVGSGGTVNYSGSSAGAGLSPSYAGASGGVGGSTPWGGGGVAAAGTGNAGNGIGAGGAGASGYIFGCGCQSYSAGSAGVAGGVIFEW